MLGLWLLASILIPAALSLYLQPFFIARYTIAASVAWYILVGVGLARIAAGRDWGVAVLVVIVISLTGSSLFAYYRDPDKSDWRTAAPLLHANVLDTDLLLVTPRTARLALQFYYGESDRITNVIGTEYFKAPKVWVLSEAPRPCPKSFNGGRRLDFERQLRALTICRYGALMGG
jgi:hypothetical protein